MNGVARPLLAVALPVAAQTVFFSSKGLVDAAMLGSQGEVDVAAVGLAARAMFVATMFVVGLSVGVAQLGAQIQGGAGPDRDARLRRTVRLGWAVSLAAGAAVALLFLVFPRAVMGLGTDSPEVVDAGAEFLRLVSVPYLLLPYTTAVGAGLRVSGAAATGMVYACLGVVLNVAANAVLITGLGPVPALGITGAAYGTVLSAVVETALLALHLRWRGHVLAALGRDARAGVRRDDLAPFLRLALPAATNSTLWALGTFAFYAVVGGMSVTSATALAILSPVESLALAFSVGLANGASVLVGARLGAGEREEAYALGRTLVVVSVVTGVVTCVLVRLLKVPVLGLFPGVSPESLDLTGTLYDVMVAGFVLKSVAMTMVLGVLRSGGEARFCLLLDVTAQWVLLLPLALVLRFVLDADPVLVFALLLVEEAFRLVVAARRIRSRRWLVRLVPAG
ncbi:MATE family efflux transporter [Cellulosimicrobium marinum]|uniref:MATE family efflux transporter n=1 Tax=Cellulosimicrobium marinum TaxID=1638992 RepID=UPI001E28304F|nr:MATE family efflux transporter [Cellulosimicrobium marinum]MCB7134991.1 hypothetical protein [Cellulosimicrobium marinum]